MRQNRIDDEREASGPSIWVDLAFVAGILIAAFLLYGQPRLVDVLMSWLA